MPKVQNFAEITPNVPFTEFDFYDLYKSTFDKSYATMCEMSKRLGIHRPRTEYLDVQTAHKGQDSEHQQVICEANRERKGDEECGVRSQGEQYPG